MGFHVGTTETGQIEIHDPDRNVQWFFQPAEVDKALFEIDAVVSLPYQFVEFTIDSIDGRTIFFTIPVQEIERLKETMVRKLTDCRPPFGSRLH